MPSPISNLSRLLVAAGLVVASVTVAGCATPKTEDTATEQTTKAAPSFVLPGFIKRAQTRASWNSHVHCRAVVTTLTHVLGTESGPAGGATFEGGGFKPGIPDRRALHPPCKVHGIPTFVQINHVKVTHCEQINLDGDWTCPLWDPRKDPSDMNHIHIETDQKFRHRTGWSIPPAGDLRIQGFVFWDPDHTDAGWHYHSGWEIHSFTAWRPPAH